MTDGTEIVAVGLCTCRRPVMLRACLQSLAVQIIPHGMTVHIVVVDNEAQPNNEVAVRDFAENCPFPVHYVHEPRPGIPQARNAILDTASALGAGWIAMLDDDETAAPDWVAMLMAPEYRHVPVLGGRCNWVLPVPAPFWASERRHKEFAEGALTTKIATNNIRISSELLRRGFRFDETLGLTGWDDTQFLETVARAGYEIRRTNRAVTREPIHASRLSFRFLMLRQYSSAAWLAHERRNQKGLGSLLLQMPKLPLYVALAAIEVTVSPLLFVFGRRRFKRWALRGSKRLAGVAGTLAALVGHRPALYEQVHGH